MPGIVKSGDSHIGHLKPGQPFHQTSYSASGNSKVFVEGSLAIVVGDTTGCGDPAASGSSKVTIQGKAVHRIGDATGGHDGYVPNAAATGSSKVTAGG